MDEFYGMDPYPGLTSLMEMLTSLDGDHKVVQNKLKRLISQEIEIIEVGQQKVLAEIRRQNIKAVK